MPKLRRNSRSAGQKMRVLGDRSGQAVASAALARVARTQGDLDLARSRFLESLVVRRDAGHRLATPHVLDDLAGLLAALGDSGGDMLGSGAARLRERFRACPDGELERIEGWSGPIHRACRN